MKKGRNELEKSEKSPEKVNEILYKIDKCAIKAQSESYRTKILKAVLSKIVRSAQKITFFGPFSKKLINENVKKGLKKVTFCPKKVEI